ncbi:hypothetical protein [Streptomyces sp. TRM49041]|uniref:hypothetical protein n=1 Tax=Streptomyces sp. TRM49041 TaxID=2603216 RepID=UPI0011ED0E2B|nr:hypothetical protein [Streptomyces sp. TRM49041]
MLIPPDPGTPQPMSPAYLTERINDHATRLAAVESAVKPLEFPQLNAQFLANLKQLTVDQPWKDLTASHQQLYWSLQAVKVDVEALAITTNGVSLMGAQLIKNPLTSVTESMASSIWQRGLRATEGSRISSLFRTFVPDNALQEQEMRQVHTRLDVHARKHGSHNRRLDRDDDRIIALDARIDRHRDQLGRHETSIRGLLRNQQRFAGTAAGDVQRRGNTAEDRSRSLAGRPGQRRAADGYRAEAAQLNRTATSLREVRAEAERLERALG